MYYFAYGLNLHKNRNLDWKYKTNYKLPNYKWIINSRGVATVYQSKDDYVWGSVFEISSEALDELDRFEGYPDFYDRIQIPVDIDQKEELAWCYIDPVNEKGVARDHYIENVIVGAKQMRLPKKWINYLEEWTNS